MTVPRIGVTAEIKDLTLQSWPMPCQEAWSK